MKKTFDIEIDCAACAAKVERAIAKVEGVTSVSVNFISQKMKLEADDARFGEVLQAAVKAGKKAEADFEVNV